MHIAVHEALRLTRHEPAPLLQKLRNWKQTEDARSQQRLGSSPVRRLGLKIPAVPPVYDADSPTLMGFEVINACFDAAFARDPRVIASGGDGANWGMSIRAFAECRRSTARCA